MANQEYLKQILSYNPESGEFHWRINKGTVKIGDKAGWLSIGEGNGYIKIMIDAKEYSTARLAILYMEGRYPKYVDHINNNRSDDRYSNLRVSSPTENTWNRAKASNNTSGVKGLSYNTTGKGRWACNVTAHGRRITKYFRLEAKEEAILWLKETRLKLHKEYTNHG